MKLAPIYVRTLEKAANTVGGHDALAAHLQISLQDLTDWMSGRKIPPSRIFTRLVDIVATASIPGESVDRAKSLP